MIQTTPEPTFVRTSSKDKALGLLRHWWMTSWITPDGPGLQLRLWHERGQYRAEVRAAIFHKDPQGRWLAPTSGSPHTHTWCAGRSALHSARRLARINAETTATLGATLARAGRDDLLAILAKVEPN